MPPLSAASLYASIAARISHRSRRSSRSLRRLTSNRATGSAAIAKIERIAITMISSISVIPASPEGHRRSIRSRKPRIILKSLLRSRSRAGVRHAHCSLASDNRQILLLAIVGSDAYQCKRRTAWRDRLERQHAEWTLPVDSLRIRRPFHRHGNSTLAIVPMRQSYGLSIAPQQIPGGDIDKNQHLRIELYLQRNA